MNFPKLGYRSSGSCSIFSFVHDLFRKPVPTFRDHALSLSAGALPLLPLLKIAEQLLALLGVEVCGRRTGRGQECGKLGAAGLRAWRLGTDSMQHVFSRTPAIPPWNGR